MQKSQKGFTLIELVVVIVLLGILGVTALARYQDLSTSAATAANSGIASELSSAAAINYAASLTGVAGATDISDTTTPANVDCPTVAPLLFAAGSTPTGYTIADTGVPACAAIGNTFSCDVTNDNDATAITGVATIICTGG